MRNRGSLTFNTASLNDEIKDNTVFKVIEKREIPNRRNIIKDRLVNATAIIQSRSVRTTCVGQRFRIRKRVCDFSEHNSPNLYTYSLFFLF